MILLRVKLKYLLLIPIDLIVIFASYTLCFLFWDLNAPASAPELIRCLPLICALAAVYLIVYFLFDMYNISLRQISFPDLFTIFLRICLQ